MITRLGFVIIMLSVLCFSTNSTKIFAGETSWVLVGHNSNGKYYYDDENWQCYSGEIIAVWTKHYLSDNLKNIYVKKFGPEFKKLKLDPSINKLNYIVSREVFDCKNKRNRDSTVILYTIDGTVIHHYDNDESSWRIIAPESVSDALYDQVCGYCNQSQ